MNPVLLSESTKLINESEISNNVTLSLQYFQTIYKDDPNLSILAIGADTIFSQAAKDPKIKLISMAPSESKVFEENIFTSQLMILKDYSTQNEEKNKKVVSTKDTKIDDINEAYKERCKRLVDKCDVLLAVWDCQENSLSGDLVAYANEKGKPVHVIKEMFENAEQGTDDLLFEKLDKAAVKYKEWFFQPAWYMGLVFAICGVIFFAIGMAFHMDFITPKSKISLASYEVISIFVSAILILFVARKYKNHFLENRRNAEYLRTLLWFKDARISLPLINKEKIYNSKNLKHSPIIINSEIHNFEQQLSENKFDKRHFEDSKRKLWIFAQDQIDYHEKIRLKPLRKKEKGIHILLDILKWLFYLSISIKVLIELQHYLHEKGFHFIHLPIDFLLPWLNLLLIVVPSIFAVLETVRSFEEWERNQAEAIKMKSELEQIQEEITNVIDNETLNKASKNLRIALEKENVEWADRVASLTPGVHI